MKLASWSTGWATDEAAAWKKQLSRGLIRNSSSLQFILSYNIGLLLHSSWSKTGYAVQKRKKQFLCCIYNTRTLVWSKGWLALAPISDKAFSSVALANSSSLQSPCQQLKHKVLQPHSVLPFAAPCPEAQRDRMQCRAITVVLLFLRKESCSLSVSRNWLNWLCCYKGAITWTQVETTLLGKPTMRNWSR